MSDYGAFPPPPPSEGYGQAVTPAEPPPAIKTSVNIVWALVAVAVLNTILTLVLLDDVIKSSGLDMTTAEEDTARSGAVIVAIVVFLIFGALWILLGIFLRKGASWARIVLTVLAALGLVVGLFGLTRDQPAVFLLLSLVQLALFVALLVFMWRPESSQYIAAQRGG